MTDSDLTRDTTAKNVSGSDLPDRGSAGSRRRRRLAGAVGLLLAGGLGGGLIAATSSASAAGTTPSSSPSSASSSSASSGAAAAARPGAPADTSTSTRTGEKAQTGTILATLKAAALKAVPGGTVFRVETDADGATYEAHMTKADGTHVTVKFDKNFKVTAVQEGMGAGGPGRSGGTRGSGAPADDAATSSTGDA